MDYEYKDQHFSVEIAEALLYKTKVWTSGSKSKKIRKYLLRKHQDKGGLEPLGGGSGSIIMFRALDNLRKKGKTSLMGNNVWRIAKEDQWIFGEGEHWVYLYYFARDKRDAESKGISVWECKIGQTKGVDEKGEIKIDAPEKRVKNQTSGTRKPPVIALLFRTDSHKVLEKVIHGILTLQGKHIEDAQGDEWFLTNPIEVTKIVASIDYQGLIYPVVSLSQVCEK